ncbi:MAG: hypothetical protein ACREQI_17285 [Candidatus Binataceae bacterium]
MSKTARIAALAIVCVAALGMGGAPASAGARRIATVQRQMRRAPTLIAQDGDQIDEPEVPQSQVDKYVAVYKAMQRDHSLTAAQAAAQQGFTVEQFRALENRIMGNNVLHAQVRKALRDAARAKTKATPGN